MGRSQTRMLVLSRDREEDVPKCSGKIWFPGNGIRECRPLINTELINIGMAWQIFQGHLLARAANVGAIPIVPIFKQITLVLCVVNDLKIGHGYGTRKKGKERKKERKKDIRKK